MKKHDTLIRNLMSSKKSLTVSTWVRLVPLLCKADVGLSIKAWLAIARSELSCAIGKHHITNNITKPEMMTVIRNTPATMPNNFPNRSVFCRLAMEDAIVKNTKGMMAVKSRLRKMSPMNLKPSTCLP